ncbi:hypothetical protein AYO44_02530 [Planctomycetaceae bacterium SCGC AG-212-F19]|nr:hypothetical protein AYO44_02530 [Planctomycetaceae bacterium SCGC AG-212-F19]
MRSHAVCFLLLGLLFSISPAPAAEPGPKGGPEEFKELKYRSIGPALGGRVCRSCGIPGDPLVYYAATASGGVWKSTDGGLTWKPIFDEQNNATIGSIAVAPSDPNVVYVGTGEANIRGNVQPGNGIFKSIDAGKTWKQVWKQEGQIGTIIVHPTNPEIAFAAVLGKAFGPNPERGVFRTTNGGKTWGKVLYKDADTGASDVCFDPTNPNILFAGLWQTRRKPWEFTSGGPGSGLYVSRDAGETWKQLGGQGVAKDDLKGLPEGIYGKVCVAVAASDPRRVYAMIENEKGGLYRSDDGGESWKLANGNHYVRIRPWYFSTVHVDPLNADVVYCPAYRLLKSTDGGTTFKQLKGPHHVDHHDLWIDPKNPKRMIDSNDGGVDITTNGGTSWFAPPLPICQFYRINVDSRVPYHVSGTIQDIGAGSGPSNSLCSAGILLGDWHTIGGGETGHTMPDPGDPNIVYAGEYGGFISRYDHRTRQARHIGIYPTNPSGHGAEDLRYRFQWTAPILVSVHDPKTVYHGANVLFQTTDAGKSWKAVSGDLTRNDKAKQKWSGGPITGDNTGVEVYGTIFALAESPRQKGLLWAGTDDGLVHISRDAGKTWDNVTKNIPNLPEWATVQCIEPSPFDAGTAYVVAHAYRMGDNRPYLWKTGDFGKTWKALVLPQPVLAPAAALTTFPPDETLRVIREDPKKKGQLYAGGEHGVWFSVDDGATWKQLKLNLPTVAVTDLRVKDNDLVVGTNGRSIWIFDDLTPLREMTPKIASTEAHLFSVQPTIRWRYHSSLEGDEVKGSGENPPKGAIVSYFLRAKAKDVKLEVLDGKGSVVATLTSKEEDEEPEDAPDAPDEPTKKTVLTTAIGVNRVTWDLRHQAPQLIKGAKWDGGNPKRGPLALPGSYTLRLTADGQVLTGALVIQPDPRVGLPIAELEAQAKQTATVLADITRLSATVEAIRAVRKQLTDRNELLKDNAKAAPLIKAAKELSDKLDALEAKLHNPKAEVAYDILAQKGGAQLYSKLIALFDWLHDSDGAVTQGMQEVYAELSQDLAKLLAEYKTLQEDLAKVNELARKLEVPGVIVPEMK